MGAERLPGKPLLAETGKPLVVHTWEAARRARCAKKVIVATDEERVLAALHPFVGGVSSRPGEEEGLGTVIVTGDCRSGTDRVADVAAILPGEDLILNVQGDEPEIDPDALDALAEAMEADPSVEMGTLAAPLGPGEDAVPSVVKVVVDARGFALYFSRAPIPFRRDPAGPASALRHVGVYAYRRAFLDRFRAMGQTPLERTEMLEQLRALENGARIRVVTVDRAPPGIDTPEDYAAFVRRWRERKP
jgi:3-deoxy-manno-octulosonate cytidylyltransferase (CMP-KDO synthetase)